MMTGYAGMTDYVQMNWKLQGRDENNMGYGDVSIGGGGDELVGCASDCKRSSSSCLSHRRQLFARLAIR